MMDSFIFPLQYLISTLSIFIIVITLPTSYGVSDDYKGCSYLVSCGKVQNIGYPFWGAGRPRHCGHPALQLECPRNNSDDYPITTFKLRYQYSNILQYDEDDPQKVSYRILNIQKYGQSMTVKLQELPLNSTCPICFTSIEEIELFDYIPTNENIRLFYNCSPGPITKDIILDSITCWSNITAYYLPVLSESRKNEVKSCEQISVPVPRKELDDHNKGNGTLLKILQQGFEVEYSDRLFKSCSKCEASGGICGSSDVLGSDFFCHCQDSHYEPFSCEKSVKASNLRLILGLGCLGVSILMLSVILVLCRKKRLISNDSIFWKGRVAQDQNADAFLRIYGSLAPKRYTYASIRKMTNYFKEKLGEGGYANVYKGKLCNGHLVAVKLFKQTKCNGEDFINEVASIGRTNHVNIVALLGFCFEGQKRALIYEFMPNGSLEKFIYCGGSTMSLPCETLFNIAVGIASGLDYLHRGCNARILHFDIKPHNILLDEQLCPKISDFGLARLCPAQESSISMLEARGTIGYIAPEVFCRNFGGVSHKSDVYSYGMMVLDLVCGRTNVSAAVQRSSELYFPQWIYNKLELGEEVAVHGMTNDEDKDLQRKMILVSLWCIQTYPSTRPSMSRVLEMLNGCLESIQIPPKACLSSPPRLVFDSSGTPRTTL